MPRDSAIACHPLNCIHPQEQAAPDEEPGDRPPVSCGWHRALSDRLDRTGEESGRLTARLTDVPQDVPDIHPGIVETCRRGVERLTGALSHPDAAFEAADAIREVIDRIIATSGDKRGSYIVTLQGKLGTIHPRLDRPQRRTRL